LPLLPALLSDDLAGEHHPAAQVITILCTCFEKAFWKQVRLIERKADLTRRANHGQGDIIPSSGRREISVLADADERAPDGGKPSGDQKIERAIAKRAAVAAHISTKRTEFVISGGIE
jgi:hypothetical protein